VNENKVSGYRFTDISILYSIFQILPSNWHWWMTV
jgi:hypothetical protein